MMPQKLAKLAQMSAHHAPRIKLVAKFNAINARAVRFLTLRRSSVVSRALRGKHFTGKLRLAESALLINPMLMIPRIARIAHSVALNASAVSTTKLLPLALPATITPYLM